MKLWITYQSGYHNAWRIDVLFIGGKFDQIEQTYYRHSAADAIRCAEFLAGIRPDKEISIAA